MVWLVMAPAVAAAHPLAPALIELEERAEGRVAVRFKTSLYPRSREAAEQLQPRLPSACARVGVSRVEIEGGGRVERFSLECAGSLIGSEVGVNGLRENGIDALLRVKLQDGRTVQSVLRADQARFVIPSEPDRFEVLTSYLDMGVRHIFSGVDHLLFVFGLVLLVASGRGYVSRLLVTLSAFTLGHCVTLSGAAVGWIRLPGPPVEFLIALSVLALAVELARGEEHGRSASLPWLLAGGFGLLHGLGFAGALLEAGLPEGEIFTALLAFNLGIEVGQALFVAVVLPGIAIVRLHAVAVRLPGWASRVPVYAMGSLAAMWCFERLAAIAR